jgi:hypothetical protein
MADPGGDWFDEQGPPPVTTAPATPPTGGGAAPGKYTPYSDEALQAILHKYDPSDAMGAVAEIDRTFGPGIVKLLDHPTKHDKFETPTGTYDTVIGAGGANPSWGWMREGGGGGATLGAPAGTAGSFMQSPMAGRNIVDDPSYKFRLDEGIKALDRSASAKGTLLTGGAAKAMQRYAQDVASTEYSAAYGRAKGEQENQFDRLYKLGTLGANTAGQQAQTGSGYATSQGNLQLGTGYSQAGQTATNASLTAGMIGTLGDVAQTGMESWGDFLARRKAGGTIPAGKNPIPAYIPMPRG